MKNSTPQNLSAFLFSVVILVVCYISIGCSTALKIGGPKPEKITLKEPVLLQINPQAGEFERTRFHSHSISETYEGPTLRYAVTEVVDFVVESKTKVIDQKNGSIEFLLSTTEKSGPTNLGDLGFPEIGKSFDLVVTPQGKVLKAGKFPKTSLYYVPPISLPEKPVKVGDTWEMSHTWTSASNGMPMEVNLVSIFKSVYQCGAY
ncbi:MAG: hypothetical protein KDD25_02310, partial [Bdellovibrionales bacterium]|nr:hypothetical protein [Bdellovibrionales bacterium]